MDNMLMVNLLCGYHDFDYYDGLARDSELACIEIMKAGDYYVFLTTEEAVRKQYDRSWKLRNELLKGDINTLSQESLELLADLILEDCCPD